MLHKREGSGVDWWPSRKDDNKDGLPFTRKSSVSTKRVYERHDTDGARNMRIWMASKDVAFAVGYVYVKYLCFAG